MNYYCIMVRTGGEDDFKADALEMAKNSPVDQLRSAQFWFFRHKLRIGGKQNGRVINPPMFPGYVFMGLDGAADDYVYEEIRKVKNFFHFLSSNSNRIALYGNDLQIFHNLVRYGETIGFSRATFDENDRIQIISGPLEGFQGNIIKVDKRKKRVTVRFDMGLCKITDRMDFSYEDVNKVSAASS